MMKSQPQISVIVPVYNSENTAEQALRSVLCQTYQNFELIVVDDGSTDRSWEIVKKLELEDSRIRAFRNEVNIGLMKTLNRAISLAHTPLLARLDSDDEMLPTRLEKQFNYLNQHPDVAVVGTWYSFMGRSQKFDRLFRLPVTPSEIQQQLLVANPICHSSVMIRKDIFESLGGYRDEFRNSEDYDLWLRLSKNYKIANIAESLVRVRLSLGGNSIAHRNQMIMFRELAKASYLHPEKSLDILKTQIETSTTPQADQDYLRTVYWELTKSLLSLGLYSDALKTFISYIKV